MCWSHLVILQIFVAGISAVLSSEMVIQLCPSVCSFAWASHWSIRSWHLSPFPLFQLVEIVSSFGQLAAYCFVCNEDLGGRCAFLEVWFMELLLHQNQSLWYKYKISILICDQFNGTVHWSLHYKQGMCWPQRDEAWWVHPNRCSGVS